MGRSPLRQVRRCGACACGVFVEPKSARVFPQLRFPHATSALHQQLLEARSRPGPADNPSRIRPPSGVQCSALVKRPLGSCPPSPPRRLPKRLVRWVPEMGTPEWALLALGRAGALRGCGALSEPSTKHRGSGHVVPSCAMPCRTCPCVPATHTLYRAAALSTELPAKCNRPLKLHRTRAPGARSYRTPAAAAAPCRSASSFFAAFPVPGLGLAPLARLGRATAADGAPLLVQAEAGGDVAGVGGLDAAPALGRQPRRRAALHQQARRRHEPGSWRQAPGTHALGGCQGGPGARKVTRQWTQTHSAGTSAVHPHHPPVLQPFCNRSPTV
jgi:hypothetical protein